MRAERARIYGGALLVYMYVLVHCVLLVNAAAPGARADAWRSLRGKLCIHLSEGYETLKEQVQ